MNTDAIKALLARLWPNTLMVLAGVIYLMLAGALLLSAWTAVSLVIFFFKHFVN